jgi:phosphoribosylformimino-5-aminoimidazole carboxamide ribotide isomerase
MRTRIRVIPVLDLRGGAAVHAVRGERHAYRPVRSVLAPSADPVALARAFRDRLGVREVYVADLDAIAGTGGHAGIVAAVARLGLAVWLDAGIAEADDARRAAVSGAARVVVGSETLQDVAALAAIVHALGEPAAGAPVPGGAAAILSLDHRDGRLLGGSPAVAAIEPPELAALAWAAGIRTFIVLDLARVGARAGPPLELARRVRARLPAAEIVLGGGVRGGDDLRALAGEGFPAVLVGTALHEGVIGPAELDPSA